MQFTLSNTITPYHQEILDSIEALRREIARMNMENVDLRRENSVLKAEIEKVKAGSVKDAGIFSEITDNERLALRQQLSEYIHRLEMILGGK